jgi:hypothetical protein
MALVQTDYYPIRLAHKIEALSYSDIQNKFKKYLLKNEIEAMWLRILIMKEDLKKHPTKIRDE